MTIRIGILGFAHSHVGSYCGQWRSHPAWGIEVCCGWDHDTARLARAADNHLVAAFADIDEMLAQKNLDAVIIASETALHAELVEKSAAAGKAIILQKPLALTMAEADRIVDAVNRHGVPFTVAWQMRVDPQNLRIREMLQAGTLGQLFMVRRRHGLPFLFDANAAKSWHTQATWNRDLWADDSSHPVDFVNWLFGMPESATAELATLYNPQTPMDNGIVIYRYANGPLVEVSCSFVNRACENVTEIIGEKGSIVQNYGDVPSCNVPRPEGAIGLKWFLHADGQWTDSEIPTPENHGARIHGLAKPLAAFLRGETPAIASAEEGRDSLKMVLATYVSARHGRRVMMTESEILEE